MDVRVAVVTGSSRARRELARFNHILPYELPIRLYPTALRKGRLGLIIYS